MQNAFWEAAQMKIETHLHSKENDLKNGIVE